MRPEIPGIDQTHLEETKQMRLALLGTAIFGLAAGVAACGQSPVQPGATTAASEANPTNARLKKTAPVCESSVYPTSLCLPANRPALCAALLGPDPVTFDVYVSSRPATATFTRYTLPTGSGSSEVLTIPRGYGLPPTVLSFTIGDDKIAAICATS
jgi:hypothetical protein